MFIFVTEGDVRPVRVMVGPLNVTRLVGETAILECSAAGLPAPVITWTRQGLSRPD